MSWIHHTRLKCEKCGYSETGMSTYWPTNRWDMEALKKDIEGLDKEQEMLAGPCPKCGGKMKAQ